jgi:hypothetical protein
MQLARMLGLSRQRVGLFLREFEAAGLVRLSRNRFELLHTEGAAGNCSRSQRLVFLKNYERKS